MIPWVFVLCVVFVALLSLARFGPVAYLAVMIAGFLFCMHMAGHFL